MVGKKRRPRKGRPRRGRKEHISSDDVIELLAWMEFCVFSDRNGDLFKQSVVDHFRRNCGRRYTFERIDEKVRQLWQNYQHGEGRNYPDHQCLYRIGLSGLSNLTSNWRETRQKIMARVMELRLHKAQKTPPAPRAGGDTSVVNTPKASKIGKTVRSKVAGPMGRGPIHSAQTTKIRCDNRIDNMQPSVGSHLTEVPQSPMSDDISLSTARSANEQSSSPSYMSYTNEELGLKPSAEASQPHENSFSTSKFEQSKAKTFCGGTSEAAHENEGLLRSCEYHTEAKMAGEVRITVDDHEAGSTKRFDLAEENERLKQKLAVAETKLAVAETKLATYAKDVERLSSMLNDKARWTSLVTNIGKLPFGLDSDSLENKMSELQMVMQQGFSFQQADMHEPCRIAAPVTDTEISTLSARAFRDCEEAFHRLDFLTLLRSLISASVCLWVFETRFEHASLTNTPLFEACLSGLRLLDGRIAVRNLHFVGNAILIEQDHFQKEVIPEKAAILVNRLLMVLTPLFTLQKPVREWSFNVLREWEKCRPRLQRVFNVALQVKAQAVISKAIFEADLPPSGTSYVASQMDSPESVFAVGLDRGKERIVLAPLVPGLRVFAHDPDRVDYDNFRRPDYGSGADSAMLKKPLVLVGYR